MTYLLALDQGTTSSRSLIFRDNGQIAAMAQQEIPQHYPQAGWVEHAPANLWESQLATAQMAIKQANIKPNQIKAIGIANQRETTLLWNRRSGEPLHNAIVWQDRRTEPYCEQLRQDGHEAAITQKTGLRIDPYFSASKLKWLLDNVPGARRQAENGELAFGTVDSWLLWKLTGGRLHATDTSNASRTLLFNIHTQSWDDELLALFAIPPSLLPRILPSSTLYETTDPHLLGAAIPIGGVAGDQQSALFGQACFDAGMAKNTYGTGCFALLNTGTHFQLSSNGLLTTPTAGGSSHTGYALEGSVFVGGAAIQWLRDGLHAIRDSAQVEALACSVPDSGGVVFVPAFTGLGAPYWQPQATGTITGLSRGSTIAHIAHAALESIAFQSTALLQAMDRDACTAGSTALNELRVDGGASANNALMQMQANLLGIRVTRPKIIETTALGAAFLAGLASGVYQHQQQLSELWSIDRVFEPQISKNQAESRMQAWEHAVRKAALSTP